MEGADGGDEAKGWYLYSCVRKVCCLCLLYITAQIRSNRMLRLTLAHAIIIRTHARCLLVAADAQRRLLRVGYNLGCVATVATTLQQLPELHTNTQHISSLRFAVQAHRGCGTGNQIQALSLTTHRRRRRRRPSHANAQHRELITF